MIGSKLANVIVRGIVSGFNGGNVDVSTFSGEAQGDVKYIEPMGISSRPDGGDVVILSINGSASRRVALPIIGSIQAEDGTTVIYSPDGEAKITMKDGGVIEIQAESLLWNGKRVIVEGDRDTRGDRQL